MSNKSKLYEIQEEIDFNIQLLQKLSDEIRKDVSDSKLRHYENNGHKYSFIDNPVLSSGASIKDVMRMVRRNLMKPVRMIDDGFWYTQAIVEILKEKEIKHEN